MKRCGDEVGIEQSWYATAYGTSERVGDVADRGGRIAKQAGGRDGVDNTGRVGLDGDTRINKRWGGRGGGGKILGGTRSETGKDVYKT